MKIAKHLLQIAFFALFWTCTHHHGDPVPGLPVVDIQISIPTENQVFRPGDTIRFKSSISASAEIHGWGIALRRKGDDSLIYSWTNQYHDQNYNIDRFWVNSLFLDTTLILSIDAAINHTGDLVSKKLNLKTRKS